MMRFESARAGRQPRVRLGIVLVAALLHCQHAFLLRKDQFHYRRTRNVATRSCNVAEAAPITPEGLEKTLRSCTTARQAKHALQTVLNNRSSEENDSRTCLFGSIMPPPDASTRVISDGDLAIQTRMANKKYNIMDLIELSGDRDSDRASLSLLCLTVASTMSAIVANQNLPGPEIIRFLVVWVLCFAPLFFVGYGIATPDKLQSLLVSIQRELFPAYRQRTIQHEAGHFLMAHLLGYPIETYRANSVKNAVAFYPLRDTNLAQDKAQALGFDRPTRARPESQGDEARPFSSDAAFFGPGGRGSETVDRYSVFRSSKNITANPFLKLASINEPSESWPYRGFDEATLVQLAVVSVAGCCAEILAFGNAEGGAADLGQLQQIFASADKEITERGAENRIRFALGYTMSQLRRHLGALDAVAHVMERDGSVAECVLAIENCENVSGQDGILGDYEGRRREMFRNEKAGVIERLFLGGLKSIDENEDRYVVGKSGGYRKETYRLTGDDPFYAAIGVAVIFFVWASSGGLSLH
ncbi:hypothetical protein ACA910_000144 [Epithemia clementina (nom. ined.)]